PCDGPSHIARAVRSETVSILLLETEQALDGLHGRQQTLLAGGRQFGDRLRDFGSGALVERLKNAAALGGERHEVLAGVGWRRFTADQLPAFKALQNAAEIAIVQVELRRQFRSWPFRAMCQFVEHAHFGQRERTAEEPFVEDSNVLRVETIETAD